MNASALLGLASNMKKFFLTRSKAQGQGIEKFEELLKQCEECQTNSLNKEKNRTNTVGGPLKGDEKVCTISLSPSCLKAPHN